MTTTDPVTAADVRLMQALAQRVVAVRPELVNADASFGGLAWNWGRARAAEGAAWRRRLWFSGGELVAWGWAWLPRRVRRRDGTVQDVTGGYLAHQVHPGHAALVDEVIDWFDATTPGLTRTVLPSAADESGLARWAAHGYEPDLAELADDGGWTQLNHRDLGDPSDHSAHSDRGDRGDHSDRGELERPVLPPGFRFRTAAEAGPEAAVQAHVDAWPRGTYSLPGYLGVREAPGYRGDLHLLIEAPDGTMAGSAIMWLDEVNRTAEFEPVGTHVAHRRRGLGRALLLQGMHSARAAGATHMTVASAGAAGDPGARELYYSVGFRELSRDAPMIKPAG
ncbi:GNAT family N-acetyltransferase [Amycolatopsis sp. PS_44_ISF1]|uniref:GNAT family N-acetyltransferase n=1 Tax=Amycolatopsis sp. PS_44_ISF1 TaxID=2974917 RepID=UPI0028E03D60|nr:GNAT family N-acetyltransferase [Amycolatopsis sp. PS_44_ISF1]MDT8913330.1 GNAT family N-acetyltransferase [Amycolatopsis sp. PS_44_ISF1]